MRHENIANATLHTALPDYFPGLRGNCRGKPAIERGGEVKEREVNPLNHLPDRTVDFVTEAQVFVKDNWDTDNPWVSLQFDVFQKSPYICHVSIFEYKNPGPSV